MESRNLEFDLKGGIARITLSREKAGNAIDLELARELMHVALRCDEDDEVRAVVLTGKGRMFCAGGDVAGFAAAGDGAPALIKEMTTYLHAAISRFARASAPVLAAVNGTAAGAGFSLACAADLAIAAESAKFTMAYTRVGLTPDGSSTYYLPRIIGMRRMNELVFTNRVLSAREALDWGIVNQVVADADLPQAAGELAARLAAGPTRAYALSKRLLLNSVNETLESQMEHETRAIANAARTADSREGFAAFAEKRDPAFRGS